MIYDLLPDGDYVRFSLVSRGVFVFRDEGKVETIRARYHVWLSSRSVYTFRPEKKGVIGAFDRARMKKALLEEVRLRPAPSLCVPFRVSVAEGIYGERHNRFGRISVFSGQVTAGFLRGSGWTVFEGRLSLGREYTRGSPSWNIPRIGRVGFVRASPSLPILLLEKESRKELYFLHIGPRLRASMERLAATTEFILMFSSAAAALVLLLLVAEPFPAGGTSL